METSVTDNILWDVHQYLSLMSSHVHCVPGCPVASGVCAQVMSFALIYGGTYCSFSRQSEATWYCRVLHISRLKSHWMVLI